MAETVSAMDCSVSSIAIDSRQVQTGGLFLACSGGDHHGMDFLHQALGNGVGAVAYEPDASWDEQRVQAIPYDLTVPVVAVEGLSARASEIAGRFYQHPSRHMSVTGFTGTNGKTSSALFLAQALGTHARCGVIGTLGNGFPDDLKPGTHTTPDPVELQRILNDLKREGAGHVAMEVSSHALEQRRVEAIHFDVAVFTNLSRDHLDYHGTMEAYGASKLRLFNMPGIRCAVINLDDSFGLKVMERLPAGVLALGYGLKQPEEMPERLDGWAWAQDIQLDGRGMSIKVQTNRGDGEFNTDLLGRFNVSNLLAVLNVMLFQGVPLHAALGRLSRLQTVAGRMERHGGVEQPLVVVDYSHTPDALEHALVAARAHTTGRLICVFGCGGDRDSGKRPQMGGIAERLADRAILTDDNPRTEDGDLIIADILKGMSRPNDALVLRDRAAAIRAAVAEAAVGDLVLVCGKGHEDYQLVGDLRLDFSDREQVLLALEEMVA
ncbi:MAG: UDP-N-acetylmuramoyl-L-alanyl-D-glutamate--2,6-diaminopimelate ligase [Gammaproteobacteria bacterium]|nr:UDP-N-acetylmuramoyl-L-alanyl-D-glutamate--2,6-diaminopimelate ligase [Gammaproteobacteria bacterium]